MEKAITLLERKVAQTISPICAKIHRYLLAAGRTDSFRIVGIFWHRQSSASGLPTQRKILVVHIVICSGNYPSRHEKKGLAMRLLKPRRKQLHEEGQFD